MKSGTNSCIPETTRRAYDIAAAHPDPFDRLLLAQATCEPLHTSDAALAQYSRDLVIIV